MMAISLLPALLDRYATSIGKGFSILKPALPYLAWSFYAISENIVTGLILQVSEKEI